LPIGLENYSLTDYVGDGDRIDYYRLEVEDEFPFLHLAMDNLSADLDMYIGQDTNGDGSLSYDEITIGSFNWFDSSESVDALLAEGTYYLAVVPYSGSSNYTLTVFESPVPEFPEGYNPTSGYGLVDAAAAVAALGETSFPDVPNLGGLNWGADMVRSPEVWQQGYTGDGVVVAVVDTGVDYFHHELDDNIWINPGEIAGNGLDDDGNGFVDDMHGWDFIDKDASPLDLYGHGTHVAGTIAGENNGYGITGIAYNAQIMPVRVLDEYGSGRYRGVAAGIRYAADNGADVINLSLGGGFSSVVQDAVQYATEIGSVVVMAAGNEGQMSPGYPAHAATDWGIAVGAVDRNQTMAYFSNRAGITPLDYVTAPGVDVYSSIPEGGYAFYSGTSMATPHVAGVAALILSANPDLTPSEVEDLITSTANHAIA
jgi:subtilisin family serine protease